MIQFDASSLRRWWVGLIAASWICCSSGFAGEAVELSGRVQSFDSHTVSIQTASLIYRIDRKKILQDLAIEERRLAEKEHLFVLPASAIQSIRSTVRPKGKSR